jgi:hypothetical protein
MSDMKAIKDFSMKNKNVSIGAITDKLTISAPGHNTN